jgi:Fe-S-cluster containining protein
MATATRPPGASGSPSHPCLRCGACCASFRVAFYWAEAAPHTPEGIPESLTRKLDPLRLSMAGTDQPSPRCIALRGTVGDDAHCSEYAQRPSPCRDLKPAWEDGSPSLQCDRARLRHGLTPLTPADWARLEATHLRAPSDLSRT